MRAFAKDFFIIISFFLLPGLVQAQSQIRVENILPQMTGDSLAVSAGFKNLFSERIIGTIQSGLPSFIEIQIKILEDGKKQIIEKPVSKSIEYNIWEERYTVKSSDTTQIYTDFEEVKAQNSILANEVLIAKQLLSPEKAYTIQIRVGIAPISAGQANKVSNWLQNPNQTEEAVASENRSSGFRLNINKLISFFVNSKKGSQFRSKWFSSKAFRLRELEQ